MKLSDFIFIVTDKCNFKCSYCYQVRGEKYIDFALIKKAIDFFSSSFDDKFHISFYGGEPLLAFEQIRQTVDYIQEKELKKEVKYALTTNGSLIDDNILRFFDRWKFSLRISFDGLLQDDSRKKGSSEKILGILKELPKCRGIDFDTNSVFTPGTVKYLAQSTEYLIEMGIPDVQISLSTVTPWNEDELHLFEQELQKIRKNLIPIYIKSGAVPVTNFRKSTHRGVFVCNAGKTRMAIAPDGILWGCFLFWDYFKDKQRKRGYEKYCFGELDDFIRDNGKNYERVLTNFEKLSMDHYCTSENFCMLCPAMTECMVCPMEAALSGAVIGNVPDHVCRVKQIEKKERELFWKELES